MFLCMFHLFLEHVKLWLVQSNMGFKPEAEIEHVSLETVFRKKAAFSPLAAPSRQGRFCFLSCVCVCLFVPVCVCVLLRKQEMGCSRLFRPDLTHPRVSIEPLKVGHPGILLYGHHGNRWRQPKPWISQSAISGARAKRRKCSWHFPKAFHITKVADNSLFVPCLLFVCGDV